jgi:hypothetical protein
MTMMKRAEYLKMDDFLESKIWRYVNKDHLDETMVSPVLEFPVDDLDNCLVGDQIVLNNGAVHRAIFGNINTKTPSLLEHVLTISLELEAGSFRLARYYDVDYSDRGPAALARFLGLAASEIYPMAYDLRDFVKKRPEFLKNKITEEPSVRLTLMERLSMTRKINL